MWKVSQLLNVNKQYRNKSSICQPKQKKGGKKCVIKRGLVKRTTTKRV